MKVALYGHLFEDTVIEVDSLKVDKSNTIISSKLQYGGIFNCLDPLLEIEEIHLCCNVSLELQASLIKTLCNSELYKNVKLLTRNSRSTIKATIICDIFNGTRTNLITPEPKVDKSVKIEKDYDWIHLVYLDTLGHLLMPTNIQKLRRWGKTLSADLSLSNRTTLLTYDLENSLKNLDLVFGSPDELRGLELVNITKIIHSPNQCVVIVGGNEYTIHNYNVVSDVNVLGAGDFFAGSVIKHMCGIPLTQQLLLGAVALAMKDTAQMLQVRKIQKYEQ